MVVCTTYVPDGVRWSPMIGNIDDDGHSEMETRCPPPGHERHSGTVDDEDSAEEEKGVGLAFTAVDIDDAGQRGSALTRS